MGQVSASWSDEHTKLTMTSLQGEHEPQAWEQSGNLDPATWTVSNFPWPRTGGLLSSRLNLSHPPAPRSLPVFTCNDWWCPWSVASWQTWLTLGLRSTLLEVHERLIQWRFRKEKTRPEKNSSFVYIIYIYMYIPETGRRERCREDAAGLSRTMSMMTSKWMQPKEPFMILML